LKEGIDARGHSSNDLTSPAIVGGGNWWLADALAEMPKAQDQPFRRIGLSDATSDPNERGVWVAQEVKGEFHPRIPTTFALGRTIRSI
jgi:hypothetical protein